MRSRGWARGTAPGAGDVLMIVLMIMLVPDTLAVLVVDGLQLSERYARPLHS